MRIEEKNKEICSLKGIVSFIIAFILAIVVSYVFLTGMLTLTKTGPGINTEVMAAKRGILLAVYMGLDFWLVRIFFQKTFPFNKYTGNFVAVISWSMGFLLVYFLNI